MGYGIILSSDDVALRELLSQGPARAVADLIDAVGADSYPGAAAVSSTHGPWQRAASFHSSAAVALVLDESGLSALSLEQPVPEQDAQWSEALSIGEQARMSRDVMRSGLPVPGTDPLAGVAGPDLTAGTIRSVWWVHADSLPWDLNSSAVDAMAVFLESALSSRLQSVTGAGVFVNALTRAGGITTPGSMPLWWSGNRVCPAEGLLEEEARRLRVVRSPSARPGQGR